MRQASRPDFARTSDPIERVRRVSLKPVMSPKVAATVATAYARTNTSVPADLGNRELGRNGGHERARVRRERDQPQLLGGEVHGLL